MSLKNRMVRITLVALTGLGAAVVLWAALSSADEAKAAGMPKPATHDDGWGTGHSSFAKTDPASCYTCHDQSYCAACHYSDNPKDAYHKTNYRSIHYLDKFLDERECASCHNNQEFCVPCHEANAATAAGGGRPTSHNQPGWSTTVHSEVAAAELDTCVACHDPAGGDPVCLSCHRTGISPHGDREPEGDRGTGVCRTCHGEDNDD